MKKKKPKQTNDGARLVSAYKDTFTSRSGQIVLEDLIKTNYVIDSTYVPGDIQAVSFREGHRNAILRILTLMEMDPKAFLEQVMEEKSHV